MNVYFFVKINMVNPQLLNAITTNHLTDVQRLMSSPDFDPEDDWIPMFQLADRFGRTEVVRLLLDDERLDHDQFMMFVTNLEIMKLLLADGRSDPRCEDNMALLEALNREDEAMVRLLIADPRVDPTDFDNSAFESASDQGRHQMVQLLLELYPGEVDPSPFFYAVDRGDLEVVKSWLPRVDVSIEENNAIRTATINGNLEMIKLFLDHGADPTAGLPIAVEDGKMEIFNLLLDRGGKLTSDLVDRATRYRQVEMVQRLLTYPEIDPSVENNSALKTALRKKNASLIQLLLTDPRVLVQLFRSPITQLQGLVDRMKALDQATAGQITVEKALTSSSPLEVKSMMTLIHGSQHL